MKEFLTDFKSSFSKFHSEKIIPFDNLSNENTFISFVYPIPNLNFNNIFNKIREYSPSLIFEKPDEDFKIIALDSIYTFSDKLKTDQSSFSSVINNLKENTIENWGKDFSKEIPLIVGGMKFFAKSNSELWNDFKDSNWFIPKFLFIKKNNFTGLVFNTFLKSIKDFDKYIFKVKNELEKIIITNNVNDIPVDANSTILNPNGKADKENWIGKVKNILELIRKNEIQKVVLSRNLSLKLNNRPNWKFIYKNLTTNYPTCHFFIYHNNNSFFFGSTPERLAKFSNGFVEVDALAGSTPRGRDEKEDSIFADNLLNSKKNLAEHNFVIDHITETIRDITDELEIKNKYSIKKLKNIQHLHSRISGRLKNGFTAFDILMNLYPTPAICGVSRDKAFSVINEFENYDRGMYSGVIGWFNFNNEGEFTVALRSALTDEKNLTVFAGSGIVANSNPNTEFEETEIKLKAILNLFDEENKSK
ncbi:MAG: hypothetical protein CO128_01095 [Ignavibacteriales bacterium CG_4_9_14_3_um_filter_30_11]|nr:MAG: hypothetical protein CO128_01095 [Ignavibacteriales bacterium CG_4_9_14_3_um_filter_30_11]